MGSAPTFVNSKEFKLFAGPGFSFCNEGVVLNKRFESYVDCASLCMANSACNFYSQWHSGTVRWCQLTSSCGVLEQQRDHLITIFHKKDAKGATTTPEGSSTSSPS